MSVRVCCSTRRLLGELRRRSCSVLFLSVYLRRRGKVSVKARVQGGGCKGRLQVACVSACRRCTVGLFHVRPFSFLMGPVQRRRLFQIVNRLQRLLGRQGGVFRCASAGKVRGVSCSGVLCFCDLKGEMRVIASRGRCRCQKGLGSMTSMARRCFLLVRGSCLVGVRRIRRCRCSGIIVGSGAHLDVDGTGHGGIERELLRARGGEL